jgi:nucleotidyltransferase/DNA polymerase involved in DNA repair
VKRQHSVREARGLCPEMIFVQVPTKHSKADLQIYRDAGASVAEELGKHGIIERASIDEAYLDVTKEANELLEKCERGELSFLRDVLESEFVNGCHVAGALEWECNQKKQKKNGGDFDGDDVVVEPVIKYASHRSLRAGAVDEKNNDDGEDDDENNDGKNNNDNINNERKAGDPPPQDKSTKSWLRDRLESEWTFSEKLKICGAYVCNVARKACVDNLSYTLSCGVSSNKMLAKLTSGMNKPNCCTILGEWYTPALLENLPIDRIRGLGGQLGAELSAALDVSTIGALARLDRKTLLAALRGDEKRTLWVQRASRGVDDEPVKERAAPKSIQTSKTFRGRMGLETTESVLKWIGELASELAERVELDAKDWNRHPKTLTLGVKSDLVNHFVNRSAPLSGSGGHEVSADSLKQQGGNIFQKFLADYRHNKAFRCSVLSLTVSNFKSEVEKSDVGNGLGKFLQKGVDVFGLNYEEKDSSSVPPSAQTTPLKQQQQKKLSIFEKKELKIANTTRNNKEETDEQRVKREELYNAQILSGIDEETLRAMPADIQQELRKNFGLVDNNNNTNKRKTIITSTTKTNNNEVHQQKKKNNSRNNSIATFFSTTRKK